MLQSTLENLHKELKVWDGTTWVKLLTEDDIKQWIAAGSLFRSTVDETKITPLPTPAAGNRGYYWTWAGASGYIVKSTDTPLAPSLTGAVLNPGDWLQSDGTQYVHVTGDLLSKQRWLSLGGFQPWSDTSWESGSIVSHNQAFWRATGNVVAGDEEPGATTPGGGTPTDGTALRFSMPDGLADGTTIHFVLTPTGGGAPVSFNYTTVAGDAVASRLATNVQAAMLGNTALTAFGAPTLTAGFSVTVTRAAGTFRATADSGVTVDVMAGAVTAANKWVDITPHPSIRLEELSNVETLPPGSYGETRFLTWDPIGDQWVASTTIEDVAGITFDGHPGQVIEEFVSDINTATNDISAVPSVEAVKNYIAGLNLESLGDCNELATATDGQVPVWNDTTGVWEPKTLTSPIIYLGTGAWDASKVASKADNYGMPADTQPDPKTWAPIAGDQYIDLSTGNVTVFTAAAGTNPASPPDRNVGNVIGGASPKDLVPNGLNDLNDVTITTPVTNQLLRFNTDHWENWTADYYNAATAYSKVEVDTKLATLTTTLEHEESVMAIANDPPAVPTLNDLYITGTVPTGLWAGHAGKLARWDGTAWQFADPRTNETHLVEDVAETWHWNGTAWVKVAVATTATAVSTTPVGTIIQSVLTPQQFQTAMGADGSKWRLAAGGDCTGTAYATLTGATTLPDLRGSFLRMAGQSLSGWDGGALNGFTEDSTARPKNAFTGSTNSAGGHTHNLWSRRMNAYSGAGYYSAAQTVGEGIMAGGATDVSGRWMDSDGAHSHTTTVTGGGDAETKPKSYAVNYFIKVN
jgi:hypothetical protein